MPSFRFILMVSAMVGLTAAMILLQSTVTEFGIFRSAPVPAQTVLRVDPSDDDADMVTAAPMPSAADAGFVAAVAGEREASHEQ